MNADIHDVATETLTPLVGRAMALVYVSKASLALGKTSDQLEREDVPRMLEEVRTMMAPFASRELIDAAVFDIMHRVG